YPTTHITTHSSTLLFFFYSYDAHRALHSFPTRRSSDLRGCTRSRARTSTPLIPQSLVGREAARPDAPEQFLDAGPVRASGFPAEDRKSTRLNSSHVEISYAVFCLKKKKENKINVKRFKS